MEHAFSQACSLPVLSIGSFVIKIVFSVQGKAENKAWADTPTFVLLERPRKWIDSLTGISTKSKGKSGMSFEFLQLELDWNINLLFWKWTSNQTKDFSKNFPSKQFEPEPKYLTPKSLELELKQIKILYGPTKLELNCSFIYFLSQE